MNESTTRRLSIALLAGLILWGGYGLLYYIQVPVHQMVLMADADRAAIDASCSADPVFCRAFQSIVRTITHFFTWMSPLGTYVILSVVLFALIAGTLMLLRGEKTIRWTMTPLRVFAAFLVILWLIFTSLSFGTSDGGQPFRRVFEPTSQVYDVGPQALEALKLNFQQLQTAGCLHPEGETVSGAGIYTLKMSCIQGAFFTRVLPQIAFIAFLLFAFLSVGKTLLGFLRIRTKSVLTEAAFSVGLGACTYVAILWALAVGGVLTQLAGWVGLIVPILLCYPSLFVWLKRTKDARWSTELVAWDIAPILAWVLLSYLALNFLNVLRPFPIGWDDLGSYMNRPRLMVSYGHFISTMSPFQWEYLTSLGFLLFGYDSIFGAIASMLINWTAGLIAVFTVLAFVRAFLGRGGVLAAILYYTLPLVGHFSFADMKVDNAVFAMGALSMLAAFLALFPQEEDDDLTAPRRDLTLMALAGIFAGFAFAMKGTAIMVIFALFAVTLGATLHWSAFIATVLFAMGIYAKRGILTLDDVLQRSGFDPGALPNSVLIWSLFGLAAVILGWGILRKRRGGIPRAVPLLASFGIAAALSVLPWIMHNNLVRGSIIPHFEMAAPNLLATEFDFTGRGVPSAVPPFVRVIPPELGINADSPFCKATGAKEELDRYWGYGKGLSHYLLLPWRAVMNIDATGYYVTTMPALLLFPLLLLLPAFWRRENRWIRWLGAATAFIIIEWMFLANGIPWYGVGMFLGLSVALELLIAKAPNRETKYAAGFFITASLLMCLSQRMWQFDQQQNLFEYPLGKVSAEAMRERTIPHYDDIRDVMTQRREAMPERPYVYRVGTFIPYFIPRNPEMIALTDNQLDTFNCIYQERDAALTLKRLQAAGFNSVIFDTNTATIERDVNGSLHQKVNAFVEFLNRADLGLQVVVYDPGGGIAYVLLP